MSARSLHSAIAVIILTLLLACTSKPPAPTSPPQSATVNDTLYVPLKPEWTGFNQPSDIFIGREPFIYIADTENDRVAMLDLSGKVVGYSPRIRKPIAIGQDGLFDLLVCGEIDTVINGNQATLGAVYRIKLRSAKHDIAQAPVSLAYIEPGNPSRRFTGITVLPGNVYLLTRVGPNNSSPIDPDNAVIQISAADKFTSPIAGLVPKGNAFNSIAGLSSISILSERSQDFIFTQTGSDMQFKIQWLIFTSGDQSAWVQRVIPPTNDYSLFAVSRFHSPEDITTDNFGNIYIIDAGKDSLLKFTSNGIPMHSFGGTGKGERQFNEPKGVAWYDKTLYIADTKNNRIVRFRLSTEQ
ncbi:MAG: hypothetical protein IPM69_18970 [Ignavibacteria bacterium]|nr:hypothetical protein [Ignavibacteria bacterium]